MSQLTGTFREQGFAVLEAAIPAAEVQALRAAARSLVRDLDPGGQNTVFTTRHQRHASERAFLDSAESVQCFLEEDALDADGALRVAPQRAVNKIGHALHDLVPAVRGFCRHPRFVRLLQSLGCARPLLWQTMLIFKQPGIGGEVRWHQDATYLHTDPPSVIGLWVALEDADRDNGCLQVQPGGHRSPLRERFVVDPASGRGRTLRLDDTPWPTPEQALALEVPAGTVVAFSDHLPHYSAPNRSDRSRLAFTMHCADAGARWSEGNWLQRRRLPPFRL